MGMVIINPLGTEFQFYIGFSIQEPDRVPKRLNLGYRYSLEMQYLNGLGLSEGKLKLPRITLFWSPSSIASGATCLRCAMSMPNWVPQSPTWLSRTLHRQING